MLIKIIKSEVILRMPATELFSNTVTQMVALLGPNFSFSVMDFW